MSFTGIVTVMDLEIVRIKTPMGLRSYFYSGFAQCILRQKSTESLDMIFHQAIVYLFEPLKEQQIKPYCKGFVIMIYFV
jgi:hypothetical protein